MHKVFKKHIAGNQNRKKMINFLQQDSSREYLNLENSFTWVPPKKMSFAKNKNESYENHSMERENVCNLIERSDCNHLKFFFLEK